MWSSDLLLQGLHVDVGYRFGSASGFSGSSPDAALAGALQGVQFHTQATFTYQGYPAFRSPYEGPNSLPAGGEAREVFDTTLFAGLRPWRGAQIWIDPEIDQGFGIGNTHGIAGYTSAEAYKFGATWPYARLQRYALRQTIDLGGARETVGADLNQFAGSQTANRLILTLGRLSIADIFDTNDYANNPKQDFLNWALINAATFDYAGDAWGYTYGAAAAWYVGRYALRGGIFDLSATPAGGNSPLAYALDTRFDQFQWVGEIEERHRLWSRPGTLKITGFMSRGRAGRFQDAIDVARITGGPAHISAVRRYTSRPGVSLNLQQQLSDNVGLFARAGWADGSVEPWDFADVDRTLSGGVSITGGPWHRPDDTLGIGGVLNGISAVHPAFLDDGGLGLLIGDGVLPHPALEKILESYYSYALNSSTALSFDYQFVDDPGYNSDRGPINVFAVRIHWQI